MTRIYVISMFLLPLLDLYDRLFERYGVKVDWGELIPDRTIVFGTITGSSRSQTYLQSQRFLRIKLPIHTWGFDPIFYRFCWLAHYAMWIENRPPNPYYKTFLGWSFYPPLGD